MYMDITPREVLFSIIIAAIMFLFGFLISSNIENSINSQNKEYEQALTISDNDMFQYCLETNVGNAFIEGTIHSDNPLIDDRIGDSELLYEHIEHQMYQKHTYTTTDSKGRVETHTYWSWDTISFYTEKVEDIEFAGQPFSFSKFHVPYNVHDTVQLAWNIRDVISGVRNDTYGTVYTTITENNVSDCSFYPDCDPTAAKEQAINSNGFMMILFWFGWIILTGFVIGGFYYLENNWLE